MRSEVSVALVNLAANSSSTPTRAKPLSSVSLLSINSRKASLVRPPE